MSCSIWHISLFFFNDSATTEIYTLSLHDALPISSRYLRRRPVGRLLVGGEQPGAGRRRQPLRHLPVRPDLPRSEEHTSELQSRQYLACRCLLEKKKIRSFPP